MIPATNILFNSTHLPGWFDLLLIHVRETETDRQTVRESERHRHRQK